VLRGINTVLFDLDGTLTVPVIDFEGLRARLNLPAGVSISHALNVLPPAQRDAGFEIVREVELAAARAAQPSLGAVELVDWLKAHDYATAIVTRNFAQAVDITLDVVGISIDVVITRDDAPPKPAPDSLLLALRHLGRRPRTTLMVGDYRDDMLAGKAAGATTCLVTHGRTQPFEADLRVKTLADLLRLLQA
jgi:HAD superfamily hydrolase (TIGR01509 family)